jgi:hypothetical protein
MSRDKARPVRVALRDAVVRREHEVLRDERARAADGPHDPHHAVVVGAAIREHLDGRQQIQGARCALGVRCGRRLRAGGSRGAAHVDDRYVRDGDPGEAA